MYYTDAMFAYKSEKLVIFNLSHSKTEKISYATQETLKIRLLQPKVRAGKESVSQLTALFYKETSR